MGIQVNLVPQIIHLGQTDFNLGINGYPVEILPKCPRQITPSDPIVSDWYQGTSRGSLRGGPKELLRCSETATKSNPSQAFHPWEDGPMSNLPYDS